MRRRPSGARLAGVVLALALQGTGATAADYLLAPTDAVRIRVRDWPDISGEYTVNPDGRLSMPVVGDVMATGLSSSQLSQAISDAIRRTSGSSEAPVTGVEITRFRPFFVQGDVQRPGEHVFRPGLTVLQAVSIAGGYYRPSSSSILRTDRDIATSSGDIETQTLRKLRALARGARLESALADSETIAFPAELSERASDPAALALMDNERSILALERRRIEEEARSVENIRALYQREMASLQQQIEALKREQDAVQRQLSELKGLAGRGLALTPNIITLERTLAQNQNEQLGMATASVRARQNIELAEQRQRDQRAERRRQQAEERQLAAADLADAAQRIATAGSLVEEALMTERVEGRSPGAELMERRTVMLVRHERGAVREFAADDAVILQPGDVLKVMPLPPRRLPVRTGQVSTGQVSTGRVSTGQAR